MPEVSEPSRVDDEEAPPITKPGIKALTIAEAKKGLSLTFSVPPEAVEITIRGYILRLNMESENESIGVAQRLKG